MMEREGFEPSKANASRFSATADPPWRKICWHSPSKVRILLSPSFVARSAMELSEVIINTSRRPATYVVGPANGSYLYKGSARDLQQRLKDHHAGRVSRTKNRKPLHLLFFRYFETYAEARAFENYLKSGLGREWLRSNCGRRNPVDCSAEGRAARGGKSAGISLRRFESFSLHHSLPTVRCNFPKSSSTPHGDRRLRKVTSHCGQ